ncbi:hypothetical protein [Urbifossiella limnaea]|uniref:Uncharacterized protein n=1 Tax=Urbifossiella limnaea TaxID=2528023 RepID=A0A517XQA4_9BACT|nr:hypothetical protein [Urbifossiella limnaea]QDU19687.1 hypothetical protein ETAA1_16180 [Urbifossiella limnaea]
MGASSWRYYTPYRDDPEAALQELRQRVFLEGDYSMGFGGFTKVNGAGPFDGGPFPGIPAGFDPLAGVRAAAGQNPMMARLLRAAETGDFAGLSPEERQAAQQFRTLMNAFPTPGQGPRLYDADDDADDERPGSIDEALELAAEDGTHSILDIPNTGLQRGFGVATPYPPRAVEQVFGTLEPTHEQVEESWDDVAERLERWEAHYLVVYKHGEPSEYAFIGCSGD